MEQYEDLPLLPGEATDLAVHVEACTMRWTALVRKLERMDQKNDRRADKQARVNRRHALVAHAYRTLIVGLLGLIYAAVDKLELLARIGKNLLGL